MRLHDATLAYAYACPTSPCTYMVANTQCVLYSQASTSKHNDQITMPASLYLIFPNYNSYVHLCTSPHTTATHNQHRTNWTMQALHHPHYTLTQHYTTHYTLCFFFVLCSNSPVFPVVNTQLQRLTYSPTSQMFGSVVHYFSNWLSLSSCSASTTTPFKMNEAQHLASCTVE